MAENKLTRKEHISLFKRSWRLLWQLDRVYTMTQTAAAALRGIIPYISVYMSALILDELIDAKRIDRLVLYAALTVGLTFLLQTVRSALDRKSVV